MSNTSWITNSNSFSAIRAVENFAPTVLARRLRKRFESIFENPLRAKSERFCWDYWNVPGQYRLLRTPADSFFAEDGAKLLHALTEYGRQYLGCQMISYPWMSAYLDGHYQNLHSDVPHGPWSFVYSLSPYTKSGWRSRPFAGGETMIAKPKLLRYFRDLESDQSDETSQLFHFRPQPFNQLTIFDPRYPHGVTCVEGNDDLLKARVVIHGWFTEPRPMVSGALAANARTLKSAQKAMDPIASHLMQYLWPDEYRGLLSLRLTVNAAGDLTRTEVLASHLVQPNGNAIKPAYLKYIFSPVVQHRRGLFPKSRGSSEITLPVEFRS